MTPPRVSVLMAAYNAAAYLEEAVASVLAQTMADLELIVVDDGSNDATPEILARLAARDPRIVAHRQANQGIGGATNTALALARAEYVAILDCDDAMEPERLAIQADYLDRHPEIAAVGSQWYTMGTDSRLNGIDRHPTEPEAVRAFMFVSFAMHHPTIMARKAIILACGAYDAVRRQGTRDYEVFLNLALAGHQLNNLPMVLSSWRINPAGVTHSKQVPQTEDANEMRHHAMARLALQSPETARAIAMRVIRSFPAGSEFDAKVARLLPDAGPGPALSIWQELAAKGELPEPEVLAVNWLHDEAPHAESLARQLHDTSLPWLAELVRARAGGAMPGSVHQDMEGVLRQGSGCPLSLLIPTHCDDADLPERVRAALSSLPEGGEILVFATDTHPIPDTALTADPRLHRLPFPAAPPEVWLTALAASRGRHIAWLEAGQRHHPEFLGRALAWLDSHAGDNLVYGPADRFYADAQDVHGRPVKDPSPEPRWSQASLLGKDRASLGAMVHRRTALAGLPLDLGQTGTETSWSLARYLVIRHRPVLLDLHNTELLPPVAPGNRILATVIRRLVHWYLDCGLGSVPAAYAWPHMTSRAARESLKRLAAVRKADKLCSHPGNIHMLLGFTSRFSTLLAMDPIFRSILRSNQRVALDTLREHSPRQIPLALAWWAAHRLWHKLSG